jgi:hypothetical protein
VEAMIDLFDSVFAVFGNVIDGGYVGVNGAIHFVTIGDLVVICFGAVEDNREAVGIYGDVYGGRGGSLEVGHIDKS